MRGEDGRDEVPKSEKEANVYLGFGRSVSKRKRERERENTQTHTHTLSKLALNVTQKSL